MHLLYSMFLGWDYFQNTFFVTLTFWMLVLSNWCQTSPSPPSLKCNCYFKLINVIPYVVHRNQLRAQVKQASTWGCIFYFCWVKINPSCSHLDPWMADVKICYACNIVNISMNCQHNHYCPVLQWEAGSSTAAAMITWCYITIFTFLTLFFSFLLRCMTTDSFDQLWCFEVVDICLIWGQVQLRRHLRLSQHRL